MPRIKPGTKVAQLSLPMMGGGPRDLRDSARRELVIDGHRLDMTTRFPREALRNLHGAFGKASVDPFEKFAAGKSRGAPHIPPRRYSPPEGLASAQGLSSRGEST